jgi:hypothetical protein
MCRQNFGAHSMADLTDADLVKIYKGWTGRGFKRAGKLPRRGEGQQGGAAVMITGDELMALDAAFAERGIGQEGRSNFIRRQLQGRDVIRTRRDFARVFGGLRAMSRRGAGPA